MMKKILFLAFVAFMSLNSQAQIVSSRSSMTTRQVIEEKGPKTNFFCIDFGAGTFSGDWKDAGVGIDLGFRWTKMFTENIGWDIIKAGAMTDTKNFGDALNVQFKTGVRGVSPVLFGESTGYVALSAGYGLYTDEAESAFVWEIGAGINFTSHFAVGVAYNAQNLSREIKYYNYYGSKTKEKFDIKGGYLSLKLSYAF